MAKVSKALTENINLLDQIGLYKKVLKVRASFFQRKFIWFGLKY